jgi:hypothetical protein
VNGRGSPISTRRYTVRVRGARRKNVTCANCHCEFAYTVSCVTSGYALDTMFDGPVDPDARAEKEARANLDAKLARDCALVPCPDCGRYQPDMVRKIKWRRFGWLVALNVLAGPASSGGSRPRPPAGTTNASASSPSSAVPWPPSTCWSSPFGSSCTTRTPSASRAAAPNG